VGKTGIVMVVRTGFVLSLSCVCNVDVVLSACIETADLTVLAFIDVSHMSSALNSSVVSLLAIQLGLSAVIGVSGLTLL